MNGVYVKIIGKYSDHIGLPVEILTKEYDDEGKETGVKWEKINKAQALWTRSKSEISDDEYKEFYKHLSHDFADPMLWAHNKVEENRNIPACSICRQKHLGICLIVNKNTV